VRAGLRADLIALPGDPLVTPEALREVAFVMVAGEPVSAGGYLTGPVR
jgi:hypothetical protein